MNNKRRLEEIADLTEDAIITQLRDECPSASLLQVARMYLRDNSYVAAARGNNRLPSIQEELAKRVPFKLTGDESC